MRRSSPEHGSGGVATLPLLCTLSPGASVVVDWGRALPLGAITFDKHKYVVRVQRVANDGFDTGRLVHSQDDMVRVEVLDTACWTDTG